MSPELLKLPIATEELLSILRAHGVIRASVFGSYARGEATADSDLDLLVDYAPDVTLFDHLDLREALQERTRRSVDVLSRRAVSEHRMRFIERDEIGIL